MRGREVLELVDEHVAVPGLHPAPELAVGEQHLDRAVDLIVEVDRAPLRERGAVRTERLGEAGHVVALGLDLLRVAQAEPDRGEPFEVRREPVGVRARPAAGHEVVDHAADVALVEHPRRAAACSRASSR